MDMAMLDAPAPSFAIFRRADARPEDGIPIMRQEPMTPVMLEGAGRMMAAGVAAGSENVVLFAGGGFSLTYAWFKSGYPLPRHSHDTDCLYYVIAGSLTMGQEELLAGDGFFVGGGTPYTYRPGAGGVEVLEFRAGGAFNIKLLAGNAAFWDKAVDTVRERQAAWDGEARPSAMPDTTTAG